MATNGISNRHPADELAEVRAAIRELKAREAELRLLLLDGLDLKGDLWRATIRTQTRELVNLAAAKQAPPDVLGPFLWTRNITMVFLHRAFAKRLVRGS
jgi:hypothetical protein